LNRENLILLNKSITSTEEKISAEQASIGQVAPVPTTDPALPTAAVAAPIVAAATPPTITDPAIAPVVVVPIVAPLIITTDLPASGPAPVVAATPPTIAPIIGAAVIPPLPVDPPNITAITIGGPPLPVVPPNIIGAEIIPPVPVGAPDQTAAETARLLRQANATGLTQDARSQAVKADQVSQEIEQDWRVRLSLAPNSNYLYNVTEDTETGTYAGILAPLKNTKGVIFPYTPGIQVQYAASYPDQRLIHTNYKIFQYQGSSVDQVTISCDFTAQDTVEANYLLAVIHFFRSLTKMFYGQDQDPNPGTPPPMCFLSGLGEFQFNKHPLVVSGFTYDLPTDVDYIRASSTTTLSGVSKESYQVPKSSVTSPSNTRKAINRIPTGGQPFQPVFATPANYLINKTPTYVPTKMKMLITCIPIVTRNDISRRFSLKEYANGKLIQGGIW
jgi:hypothetical protein